MHYVWCLLPKSGKHSATISSESHINKKKFHYVVEQVCVCFLKGLFPSLFLLFLHTGNAMKESADWMHVFTSQRSTFLQSTQLMDWDLTPKTQDRYKDNKPNHTHPATDQPYTGPSQQQYMHTNTYVHTHTHISTHLPVCVCVCEKTTTSYKIWPVELKLFCVNEINEWSDEYMRGGTYCPITMAVIQKWPWLGKEDQISSRGKWATNHTLKSSTQITHSN